MAASAPQNKPSRLLAAALALAGRGWRVIPLHDFAAGLCSCAKADCGSPGKHPRTPHGLSDGTTDPTTIRRWWTRWPAANVGVCTGPDSGVWMLGPDGQAGIDALAELMTEHGELPRTPAARSGSGGCHHYFRWPASGSIGNRKNHRGLPIDVRGAGGYFVAPPSRNKNGLYEWEIHPADCELADAPAWLLEWVRGDGKASATPLAGQGGNGVSIVDRAIAYLAKMPPAVSGQGGHDQTMEAARVVAWGFDLGAETAYQILAAHYNPRCQPLWSEKELRHKCAEADTVPFGKERGWLLQEQSAQTSSKSHARNGQAGDKEDRILRTADGLQYREGEFTLTFAKQPTNAKQRTKWQVIVMRGEDVLGIEVVNNLAEAKARRDLIRHLKDVTPEEAEALAKVLLRLAVSIEHDWGEHESQAAQRQQRQQQEQARHAAAEYEEKRRQFLLQIESASRPALADPTLLYHIGKALRGRGLVGEQANARVLYLCVLSQITEESISAVIKGDSSGGKSHLVKTVLEVVPDQAHIDLTSMSERALIYDTREYAHRTVVIYEVHGEGGEFTNYLIRTLISEGEIRHLTVESTPLGPVGREIVKEGPTNFITTTTCPELHVENETRIWTILIDDSPKTTKDVLAVQAARADGSFRQQAVEDLHAAFTWLHLAGAKEAVVPFASTLAGMMPDRPLRLRRDFPRLLQLVKVCALLHQQQRQRDAEGRVVATLADYGMVRELVVEIFERSVLGLTEKTLDLVEALENVLDGRDVNKDGLPSYSDLVRKTGKPKHYISRWLKPALEIGLVDNVNAGVNGKPSALKMGHYQLNEGGVLPTVEGLAEKFGISVMWVNPLTGAPLQSGCNGGPQGCHQSQTLEQKGDEAGHPDEKGTVAPLQSGETPSLSPLPPGREPILPPPAPATVQRSGRGDEAKLEGGAGQKVAASDTVADHRCSPVATVGNGYLAPGENIESTHTPFDDDPAREPSEEA